MNEGELLLRRILECPEDDAPRLILSDWLEEQGDTHRAKFIRLQISGEIPDVEVEFRQGEVFVTPDEFNAVAFDSGNNLRNGWDKFFPEFNGSAKVVISRGFVSEVRLTCEEFYGRACPRCENGLNEIDPDDSIPSSCWQCNGTGKIEGIVRELFKTNPVTRLALIDKIPQMGETIFGMVGGSFDWWVEGHSLDDYSIPKPIYDFMKPDPKRSFAEFPSYSDAVDVLSHACVSYGRNLVGLPDLESTR